MKVSLNWLKQYLEIKLPAEEVGHLLTGLGLEVEGMEVLQAGHNGLEGVVVGEILTCEKHPEADRLSLCTVDINDGEPLSIVCGAPNVRQGQKVLVATIGTEVLDKEGSPFKIKKGKIRGAESAGMICAEDELGIGHSHEGILVLASEAQAGTPAAQQLGLEEDVVFEIGLTPNRSDATNHIGVARDLLAAMKIRHGYTGSLKMPTLTPIQSTSGPDDFKITVENTVACPRYSGIIIRGIKVGPSPEWLRQALTAIGERSINNIVDITNFVLHELGQPLHAFDLNQISGGAIRVKNLPAGTKFRALDDQEYTLHEEDLMICDSHSQPLCMAGVFGGLHSGVGESTTDIFLESALFEAIAIRRTSTRHNLRTEAARIFEKGADVAMIPLALQRAVNLIQEIAGGEISSPVIDCYPEEIEPIKVMVRMGKVNGLTGLTLDHATVRRILEALEMSILEESPDHFVVAIPGNKGEVTREVDVIEEILRICGYDNVPEPEKMMISIQPTAKPNRNYLRQQITAILSARGYSEGMNLSLDQSARYEKVWPGFDPATLVKIHNTSNVHLDCMRAALWPNMLDSVLHNLNRQQTDIRLFEMGKTYQKVEAGLTETNRLIMVVSGRREPKNWLNSGRTEADLYTLKSDVQAIAQAFRLEGLRETPVEHAILQPAISWQRGPLEIGVLGAVSPEILSEWGIKQPVWIADLNWDALLGALPKKALATTSLNRFPTVRRDLAMVLDATTPYADIEAVVRKSIKKPLQTVELVDVYTSAEQLGPEKKSYAISLSFANPEKTLTDQEIDKMMETLISNLGQLKAEIRK